MAGTAWIFTDAVEGLRHELRDVLALSRERTDD